MKKVYSITESASDNSEIIYIIKIDFSHPVFKGHFPGRPILPGVMMCDIVRDLVSESLSTKVQLSLAKNIKFSKMISPSQDNHYRIKIKTEKNKETYNIRGLVSKDEEVYFKINAEYKEK
jgi:3-hydroxyacyl-[acyl-carrier-protein] dehydratase